MVAAVIVATALLATGVARAADFLDPGFGDTGVATPALPAEASAAAAGITDLAAAPGGGYLGSLAGLSGRGYFGVVRLTSSGAPDTSFGAGGFTEPLTAPSTWTEASFNPEAQAEALATQDDGKIVVAGYIQEGVRHPAGSGTLLARYDADGSLDPGFGSGGVVAPAPNRAYSNPVLHDVAVTRDGRIVAVGARSEDSRGTAIPAGLVFAYRPDGSPDRSFGKRGRVVFRQRNAYDAYTGLRAVQPLPSGKVLVAGYRNNRLFVARLRRNGSLDRGFGGGDGVVTLGVGNPPCCETAALAVQGNGRIVVAANGGFKRRRVYLVRLRPNGRLDRGFGHHGVADPYSPWRLDEATSLAVQANGGVLAVGRGARTKANPHGFAYGIFRYRADGSVDRTFGHRGLKVIRRGRGSFAGAALSTAEGGVLTGGSFAVYPPPSHDIATTLLLAQFTGARR